MYCIKPLLNYYSLKTFINQHLFLFFCLLIIVLLYSCANIIAPSGGPRDITPPQIVKYSQPNGCINFSASKIEIDFNEYLQLRNIYQELMISPPLEPKPQIKIKNKTLIIDIGNNELKPNTTYTLNFGDAICDLNEGNALKNFQYVFSTGNFLDSLQISGKVVDAFTLSPISNVLVMLYDNLDDSAPIKTPPSYITKTNEIGFFNFKNIAAKQYKIYALKDNNRNYIYDNITEAFAFSDSLITPQVNEILRNDTLSHDTTAQKLQYIYSPNNLLLFLFKEQNNKQILLKYFRNSRVECKFIFNRQLYNNNIEIKPLNFCASQGWYSIEKNKTNDTITCWITNSSIYKYDTLILQVGYYETDSANTMKYDTVKLSVIKTSQKKLNTLLSDSVLKISSNLVNLYNYTQPITLHCSRPISSFNLEKIKLILIEDSIETLIKTDLYSDTVELRKYYLNTKLNPSSKYKLVITPGAFRDIWGIINDTINIAFTTQINDYFGNLNVLIHPIPQYPYIVQLLDSKEKIVREQHYPKTNLLQWNYLIPGSYKLKIIIDENKNGYWDSGIYSKKKQPEKVYYFDSDIVIRSNWDMELEWELK